MIKNMPAFEIAEIFYSLQGEGFWSGTPAIFIRFCGCNLACEFCDEPLHKKPGNHMSADDIFCAIKNFPAKHIVLTGGEPSIVKDIDELVTYLKQRKNYFIQVETNGTNEITADVDWMTVSPKTDTFITGDELKLLCFPDTIHKIRHYGGFKHYFLQPATIDDKIDLEFISKITKYILENPEWRLSLQLHKIIGVK